MVWDVLVLQTGSGVIATITLTKRKQRQFYILLESWYEEYMWCVVMHDIRFVNKFLYYNHDDNWEWVKRRLKINPNMKHFKTTKQNCDKTIFYHLSHYVTQVFKWPTSKHFGYPMVWLTCLALVIYHELYGIMIEFFVINERKINTFIVFSIKTLSGVI